MNDTGARLAALVHRPEEGVLRGRSVFLAASVPSPQRAEEFRRLPDAQREIEQAVVSLARAVFTEGGRLVFGGHPSIAPLIAMVAGEYLPPSELPAVESERGLSGHERPEIRPPVVIHQLDVYEDFLTSATQHMASVGYAELRWHSASEEERWVEWSPEHPQYPQSLREMRRAIVEDAEVIAMVCVGGMEGVLEEAALFWAARRRPIYVVASTGGAAELLARGRADSVFRSHDRAADIPVVAIDEELVRDIRPQLRDAEGRQIDAPLRFAPYPMIMQALVQRIASE
jgi:hypothetical protein